VIAQELARFRMENYEHPPRLELPVEWNFANLTPGQDTLYIVGRSIADDHTAT